VTSVTLSIFLSIRDVERKFSKDVGFSSVSRKRRELGDKNFTSKPCRYWQTGLCRRPQGQTGKLIQEHSDPALWLRFGLLQRQLRAAGGPAHNTLNC
jgi:hypothetical protein